MQEYLYRPEGTDTLEAPADTHHTSPPPTPEPELQNRDMLTFEEADTVIETAAPPIPTLLVDRRQEIFRVAGELYRQTPDWVMFFREILGVDGIVRRMFKKTEELAAFEKTAEYEEIQHMLANLRGKTVVANDEIEPTKVITVRLPQSLHEVLRAEAHERQTSMNKLCISKLLQVLENEKVSSE